MGPSSSSPAKTRSSHEDGYELWFYGFDEWGNYFYSVSLPVNSMSYQASSSETVYAVAARKDGGYSDLTFPEPTSAALQSLTRTAGRAPASAQRTPPVLKTR